MIEEVRIIDKYNEGAQKYCTMGKGGNERTMHMGEVSPQNDDLPKVWKDTMIGSPEIKCNTLEPKH